MYCDTYLLALSVRFKDECRSNNLHRHCMTLNLSGFTLWIYPLDLPFGFYPLDLPFGFTLWIYPLDLPFGFTLWIYPLDLPFGFTLWIYPLDLPFGLTLWIYPLDLPFGFTLWVYPLDLRRQTFAVVENEMKIKLTFTIHKRVNRYCTVPGKEKVAQITANHRNNHFYTKENHT